MLIRSLKKTFNVRYHSKTSMMMFRARAYVSAQLGRSLAANSNAIIFRGMTAVFSLEYSLKGVHCMQQSNGCR